ncbi:DUF6934 family protein [Runella slithyformis]|uniref:Uncharacterized protein n=1 Tax=Runella slithyformis (strain ATCC 29530 / DSM 19594 / LMG 11500 / NCIMB 11436 / LSU 4) TaxID=761193 RepID=A0A7U3ZRA6_RUNSL|nr:hypothetical protein [Runella slithyformis]AEI51901.1 hypothetical protein Runsl_5611 [Runella slithyformis DSM 19594]
MKHKYYKYLRDEDCLWFEFNSVSEQKTVKKVVAYTPFQENPELFNLALADAFGIVLKNQENLLTVKHKLLVCY